MLRLMSALAIVSCFCGCYSTSLLQDARVLPAGKLQLGFGGGYVNTRTLQSPHVAWVGLGGHAGIAIKTSAKVTLLPECSVLSIASGPSDVVDNGSTYSEFSGGDLRFQCVLSVNFENEFYRPAD